MSAQTSQGVAARTVAMEAALDRKKPGLLDRIADHLRRYWQLWILSAPALFFVGLFSYVPMWGIQLAFREFDPTKGLTGGKFVGFKYFLEFFHNPLFGEIMTKHHPHFPLDTGHGLHLSDYSGPADQSDRF